MKKFIAIALIALLSFVQIAPSYAQSPAPEGSEQVYIDCIDPTSPSHEIHVERKGSKFFRAFIGVFVAAWVIILADRMLED